MATSLMATPCGGECDEEARKKPNKDCWIDRNIQEEDLLRTLCEKYQIDVDDIRAVGQDQKMLNSPKKCRKGKKLKKRKSKKSMKVETPCDLVSCPEPSRDEFKKLMKRNVRDKYSYEFGNKYPLHRACSNVEKGAGDASMVPKNMGWRWDKPILGIRGKKWFPGSINRTVHCLMKHALNPFPYDTVPLTHRDTNGRVVKSSNDPSHSPDFNSGLVQKPTLQVVKKDGEYFIKMNPLKSKDKLETDRYPYLNCSPLLFKVKKNPEEIKKHRAKKFLGERGLTKKCSCINIECCRCINKTTKKLMAYGMRQASAQFELKEELRFYDLNESSGSELDLEFTTAAGIIDERKCKPDVVHCGTQYGIKDFIPNYHTQKLKENLQLDKGKSKPKLTTLKKKQNVLEKKQKPSEPKMNKSKRINL